MNRQQSIDAASDHLRDLTFTLIGIPEIRAHPDVLTKACFHIHEIKCIFDVLRFNNPKEDSNRAQQLAATKPGDRNPGGSSESEVPV